MDLEARLISCCSLIEHLPVIGSRDHVFIVDQRHTIDRTPAREKPTVCAHVLIGRAYYALVTGEHQMGLFDDLPQSERAVAASSSDAPFTHQSIDGLNGFLMPESNHRIPTCICRSTTTGLTMSLRRSSRLDSTV